MPTPFMGWFEDIYVYTYRLQPLIWKWYIDDIFIIWQHGQEEPDQLLNYLNSCMDYMKFETETSSTSLNLLHVKVILEESGEISTMVYTKSTDSHNYINCHPRACKKTAFLIASSSN